MDALHRLSGARFELFGASPRWFFDESIPRLYQYHELETDVGLRQRSALVFDLERTVAALDAMLPFDDAWLDSLAETVSAAGCRAVLCDIAPLGVAVAGRLGLPSLLVENFTWPWLYEPLIERSAALRPLAEEIRVWLERVTWHVQTEPLCAADARADLRVPPIARVARAERARTRSRLGLDPEGPVVLVTMGGVPQALPFLDRLRMLEAVQFVVTGAPKTQTEGNLHLFDNHERLYLPDLVRASDAVAAKLGYSTVAEVWREGRPLAYVTRPDFRETGPVSRWVERELAGFEITPDSFRSGTWIERVPELLASEGTEPRSEGGEETVARFLLNRLGVLVP